MTRLAILALAIATLAITAARLRADARRWREWDDDDSEIVGPDPRTVLRYTPMPGSMVCAACYAGSAADDHSYQPVPLATVQSLYATRKEPQ